MRDIWNPLKGSNIHIIEISEKKKETLYEVTTIKNFLTLMRHKATSLSS